MQKATNAKACDKIGESYLWDRDQGEMIGVTPTFQAPHAEAAQAPTKTEIC